MVYPNMKHISEETFQFLKNKELERVNRRNIKMAIMSYHNRANYYSIKRKEIQRTMNYHVRKCNKILANDYLWRSRFFIRQVGTATYYKFDDNSGGELFVTLRFYDKKTMKYVDAFDSVARFCFGWGSVYWLANKAITEEFPVWTKDREDKDSPYNDRIDYASISNDWVAEHAEPLYPDYNYFRH